MRHAQAYRKLGRKTAHRLAMFRNMTASLISNDRIVTTLPKAKELRRWAEWVVTLAKTGTVRARRRAAEIVQDPSALQKLFGPLAERYRNRAGGYTRILRLDTRHGDAAQMAIIEYVSAEVGSTRKEEKTKKASNVPIAKVAAKKPAKAAKKSAGRG